MVIALQTCIDESSLPKKSCASFFVISVQLPMLSQLLLKASLLSLIFFYYMLLLQLSSIFFLLFYGKIHSVTMLKSLCVLTRPFIPNSSNMHNPSLALHFCIPNLLFLMSIATVFLTLAAHVFLQSLSIIVAYLCGSREKQFRQSSL